MVVPEPDAPPAVVAALSTAWLNRLFPCEHPLLKHLAGLSLLPPSAPLPSPPQPRGGSVYVHVPCCWPRCCWLFAHRHACRCSGSRAAGAGANDSPSKNPAA